MKQLRARHRVRDDERCGWVETLPARRHRLPRAFAGEHRVDCVVLGAGFTGLAIARRLHESRPEWKTAVLDAQRVAAGSSGRSSGFVVDFTDLTSKMSWEDRLRHRDLAQAGIRELRGWKDEYSIDCAWDEAGWSRAAASPRGEAILNKWLTLCKKAELPHEILDGEAMRRITGSQFYRRGIRMTGYPLIQGAALVQGLAEHLPAAVELFEDSPVETIEGMGEATGPYRLSLPGGTLVADRLFLATNAYTASLGLLERQILPVQTFGSLTRALTRREQELLGGDKEWGILSTDYMASSLRRTRDQRLMVRNTLAYHRALRVSPRRLEAARAAHRYALARRFPALEDLEFEFTWTGLTATAMDYQPTFGQLQDRMYIAAGYSGAGIALGTALGRLLADFATGTDSPLLREALALPKPRRMPPEPFRSLGARWVLARMNAKARPFL